jgi:hypothetical protein
MTTSNHRQVVALHKMWETFNLEPIKELVADDIHYESHWVLRPINGKEHFLNYIEKKLATIKTAVERGEIEIHSSVGKVVGQDNEYFLLLYHTIRGKRFESFIKVGVKNDLIVKMTIEPLKKRFNIQQMDETTNEINNSTNN